MTRTTPSASTLALAIACIAASQPALAQEADKAGDALLGDEIVVTAQKREESAQKVGIAITAFSGEQLKSLGVVNSTDVASFTPGVSLSGSSGGQMRQYTIRGVTQNDFNDHVESPNAVYIDEAYISFQQGSIFSTFDVDRVEVLKGPQGTLFGRNATGGLVHFITKNPTDHFEGYIDLTGGSYKDARVEGAVSGPLATGISFRLAGLYTRNDGWLKNDFPNSHVPAPYDANLANGPAPAGAGANLGGDDTWAIRGKLSVDLGKDTTLLISGFYSDSKQSTAPYQSVPTIAQLDASGRTLNTYRVAPGETREFISPTPGFDNGFDNDFNGTRPVPGGDFYGYKDPDGLGWHTSSDYSFKNASRYKTYGGTAKLEAGLGAVTLTSITDYKHHDKRALLDVDAAPESQFYWNSTANIDQFSEELRLSGKSDALNWVTGLYYLNIDAYSINGLSALPNGTVLPAFGFANFQQPRISRLKTDSIAFFAQADYELTSQFFVVVGIRSTIEKKRYAFDVHYVPFNDDIFNWSNAAIAGPSIRPQGPYNDSHKETLWTGKLQLQWRPSDNVMVYAGYNRGAKAGSYNSGGPDLPNALVPYKSETLHAYEIGVKSDIIPRKLRFNASAYYYDYRNYQASRWDGLGNVITNNPATIKGIEAELTASPVSGLELMLSGSINDAKVKGLDLVGDGSILKDVRPTYAPKYQFSGVARYTFSDVAGGNLTLQASLNHQSSIYHNLSNFDSTLLAGWTVANARITWNSDDGVWTLSAFADNLFDKHYSIIGFDLATVCGCNTEAQGKPRWVGVNVRRNF